MTHDDAAAIEAAQGRLAELTRDLDQVHARLDAAAGDAFDAVQRFAELTQTGVNRMTLVDWTHVGEALALAVTFIMRGKMQSHLADLERHVNRG